MAAISTVVTTAAAMTTAAMLAACPSTAPQDPAPADTAPPEAAAAKVGPTMDVGATAGSAALAHDPTRDAAAAQSPAGSDPARPLPASLRGPRVRPVIGTLWRSIARLDAGDAEAITRMMLPGARWSSPGRADDDAAGPDSMQPPPLDAWTRDAFELHVRRVIDLGEALVAIQLAVTDRAHEGTPRHELLWLVALQGDRITAIRHYGDPLGPVHVRAQHATRTLALPEPTEHVDFDRDPPTLAHVVATQALMEALRRPSPMLDDVDPAATFHDVLRRETSRGRDAYFAAYVVARGPQGRFRVDHHYASQRFVVIEGVVEPGDPAAVETAGTEPGGSSAQAHGFADLHRFEGSRLRETWHYGSRHRRSIDPPPSVVAPAPHAHQRTPPS